MFTEAKLVFKHYVPDFLEEGMLFATKRSEVILGKPYECIQVYKLEKRPNDEDAYIQEHGYPVQPFVLQDYLNPDDGAATVADYTQIGWFDMGDDAEELEDITIDQMNTIMDDYDGDIIIECDEEGEPVVYEGKITIRFADNYPMGEDDDMDYEVEFEEWGDEDFSDEEDDMSENDKNDLYERDN